MDDTMLPLDTTKRRGVLTLASVMAALGSDSLAYKDRPVQRGLMIKSQFLCEEIGPPSGLNVADAIANVQQSAEDFEGLTVREELELVMEQGQECSDCHSQFMPLGFVLGNFDGLGRFTEDREGRPIDVAVSDVSFAGQTRSFDGPLELVDALSNLPTTNECFVRNFVKYLVGTSAGPHVDGLTERLTPLFESADSSVLQLIEEALASEALYAKKIRYD